MNVSTLLVLLVLFELFVLLVLFELLVLWILLVWLLLIHDNYELWCIIDYP